MKLKIISLLAAFALLLPVRAGAQLSVMVSPVNAEGNKAVVKLDFKNDLTNAVESARASVYLLNGDKVVSQGTRWVIGGAKDKPSLAPGATNSFFFVLSSDKPFARTNLTAKVNINRLVLEGGKLGDAVKDVSVSGEK
jgi:hypothetical protein